jgi:hypothetical protein
MPPFRVVAKLPAPIGSFSSSGILSAKPLLALGLCVRLLLLLCFPKLSTFDSPPPLSPMFFPCHTSEKGTVSPLAATLMDVHARVANKRLTPQLSPLDAILTKNRGVAQRRSDAGNFRRGDVQTFPVPLQPNALGATMSEGAGFLRHPGKQLRSPRCLRIVSGHRGQLDLGPLCKLCLGPSF